MTYWLAVALALAGALYMSNRTAWALLVGVAFSAVTDGMFWFWPKMAFNWHLWVAADLLIIAAIIRPVMTTQDKLIVWLFPVAWLAYGLPSYRFDVSTAVVTFQLLLTLPWLGLQQAAGSVSHGPLRGAA